MSIVNGSIQLGYKTAAWFTANPTLVLLTGQIVFRDTDKNYKVGDGVTQLSVLPFYSPSVAAGNGITITGNIISIDTSIVADKTTAQTLTNKRITVRSGTIASSATPTINTDNYDFYSITALAVAITSFTTNLTGTPNVGDGLIIAITDNGTARAITWGAKFESSGNATLPTTTVASTRMDVGFIWNDATSKWRCIGVS